VLLLSVVESAGPSVTDWIEAGTAVLAATATIFLVVFASRQIKAAKEQADITREMSSRQWYPLVYSHEGERPAPDSDPLGEDAVACAYYLRNEGLGPALNIEHGVEVWGSSWPFGGRSARQFRSVQPGETIPPMEVGESEPSEFIEKHVPENEFFRDEETPDEVVYWCRFESLFGDRWETSNSNDPSQAPQIRRLKSASRG
jgi:hypothetical protein